MAYNINNRQRSRRHLAALTFLSNISLDGTHRDTNLGKYYNIGKPNSSHTNESFDKENQTNMESSPQNDGYQNSASSNSHRAQRESSSRLDKSQHSNSSECVLSSSNKDKFALTDYNESAVSTKMKSYHQVPLIEKVNFCNSNESIVASSIGTSGRGRKMSLTSSETSLPSTKELKTLRIEGHPKYRDEHLVLLSRSKVPCHIFSCLPYNRSSRQDNLPKDGSRRRHTSGTRPLSTISDSNDPAHIIGLSCFEDVAEISFSDLLVPSTNFSPRTKRQHSESFLETSEVTEKLASHPVVARCFSYEPATNKATAQYLPTGNTLLEESRLSVSKDDFMYIPHLLDDPELRAGKHRKLLRFPSYMTSVTDYTKPYELKKELNDKFKEKFPNIQLTLSKLRSLKRELLKIAVQECEIDILTVAQAYVYFEKMILKMYLNKQNRKLIAGACLILSAKMNDVKGEGLTNLIDRTETVLRLNRRELLSWEFACLVALEFTLHVPSFEVSPHFQRLQFES